MSQNVLRIVVIGPESTGKSTLCRELADHYESLWCPEYARTFLQEKKILLELATAGESTESSIAYQYEDLLHIARGQIRMEEEYLKKSFTHWQKQLTPKTNRPVLFIDTDMYVMKVWSEYVFGNCHTYIIDQIVNRSCDLYLLCDTDLPWVKDEMREYPDLKTRRELFLTYQDILLNQSTPWVLIQGNENERLQTAIRGISSHFPELVA